MSKGEELVDAHVSLAQCRKAVEALHSHETKKKEKYDENEILPAKEEHFWLNVAVKKMPTAHKLKPYRIPIVHPLVDPRTTAVCLITKDPQREYKDLLESHNIKFISRVVGVAKLKGKFKAFEARRMLLKENGLFLADARVIPLLPKLLGSKWFEAKKQPIPVCLTRKDLKSELERAITSTYLHQNRGTCTSIKIGKLSQRPSQILDNIQTSIPSIVKSIERGWDNIQALSIKTNSSVSLPIWSCTLDDDEGGRWHEVQSKVEVESVAKDDEATPSKLKSRKRQSGGDEADEAEKPKKKVKPTKADEKQVETGQRVVVPTPPTKPQAGSTPPFEDPSKDKKTKTSASESLRSRSKADEKKSKSLPTLKPSTLSVDSQTKPSKKDKVQGSSSKSHLTASISPSLQSSTDSKVGEKRKESIHAPPTGSMDQAKHTLSKEERKQKHSSGVLEKKKRLITKMKGMKSAKNAILGKKSVTD